ncbi:MAG: hypothetical protein F8N37_08265 [Telmatospirillum sp.]|nr:hypothetical protein [Telmatospirillum sp.]
MKPRLRRLVPITAIIPLLAACAADQTDAPAPWLRITAAEGGTAGGSGDCIGSPVSPQCAVDTLLACFQRNRPDLCRLVDAGSDQYAEVFAGPSGPARDLAYRFVTSRPDPAAPADGWELAIEQQEVDPGGPPPTAATGQVSLFRLHRAPDGRWSVTAWDDPPADN